MGSEIEILNLGSNRKWLCKTPMTLKSSKFKGGREIEREQPFGSNLLGATFWERPFESNLLRATFWEQPFGSNLLGVTGAVFLY